jgi:hypothetical protein
MRDPLDLLWALFDHPEPALRNNGWRTAAQERLIAAKLLVPAEPSPWVVCPECFDHEEQVMVTAGVDGRSRAFIPCPEHVRVEVRDRDRCQWRVSPPWIALTISACLGFERRCSELISGRLWRLGRATIRDRSRELLLARGVDWADSDDLRSRVVRAVDPVVFVTRDPPVGFWLGRQRPVVSLRDLVTLGDDGLELDPLAVRSAIDAADALAEETGQSVIAEKRLRTVVRQQIKAERQTELTDAVFVEAYRQTGSYRKAADLLSERTGQVVSKDQVSRAVNRSGGTGVVIKTAGSDSVVRRDTARRDRRGRELLESAP